MQLKKTKLTKSTIKLLLNKLFPLHDEINRTHMTYTNHHTRMFLNILLPLLHYI